MSFFKEQAKLKLINQNDKKTILFVEGWNIEIKKAACSLKEENIITPVLLLRDKSDLDESIKTINHIIINELDAAKINDYASYMYELRKHKGLELEQAKQLCVQPHYLSALMLKRDEVDGVVCGIEYTTKDTLRAALQVIKQAKDASIVTSAMMMQRDDEIMVLGDCSLVLDPDANQLASIAKELTLFSSKTLNLNELNTALLSYSTVGSGAGASVDKVKEAVSILNQDKALNDLIANITSI